MFDNLRQRSSTPFVDEEPPAEEEQPSGGGSLGLSQDMALGMTAVQRFVLALMLFLNIFVLGCFCLLATEKMVLPF